MSIGEIILYILLSLYLSYCGLICGSFCYYECFPYCSKYFKKRRLIIDGIELTHNRLETIEETYEEEICEEKNYYDEDEVLY